MPNISISINIKTEPKPLLVISSTRPIEDAAKIWAELSKRQADDQPL